MLASSPCFAFQGKSSPPNRMNPPGDPKGRLFELLGGKLKIFIITIAFIE
jgi:hypothetical protein